MLVEQSLVRNKFLRDCGLKVIELTTQAQNVFRSLGLIQRRASHIVDQIGEILCRRYEILYIPKWKNVLEEKYVHVLHIILRAEALYDAGRSE